MYKIRKKRFERLIGGSIKGRRSLNGEDFNSNHYGRRYLNGEDFNLIIMAGDLVMVKISIKSYHYGNVNKIARNHIMVEIKDITLFFS